MQTVYIETTIPSYLAAYPNSQIAIAVDQTATHEWCKQERLRYRIFTSAFTIDECSRGDAGAAARRLAFLSDVPELQVPSDLHLMETDIIRLFHLPPKAYTDASHLALAIVHRMDYLLTWNCTHLANAILQKELVEYCGYNQLHTPIICTPETLIPHHE